MACGLRGSRVPREHQSRRSLLLHISPTHDGNGNEGELLSGVFPYQPLTRSLLPPSLGLTVVHDQVGVAKPARRTEVQYPTLKFSIVRDGRVA